MDNIKLINTGKCEMLAVNMKSVPILNGEIIFHKLSKMVYDAGFTDPKMDYEILGISTELTEEQWRELVVKRSDSYKNYTDKLGTWFSTAKQSGLSILEANQIFSVNPYGLSKDFTIIHSNGDLKIAHAILNRFEDQWQQAEKNTGSWLILIKK